MHSERLVLYDIGIKYISLNVDPHGCSKLICPLQQILPLWPPFVNDTRQYRAAQPAQAQQREHTRTAAKTHIKQDSLVVD